MRVLQRLLLAAPRPVVAPACQRLNVDQDQFPIGSEFQINVPEDVPEDGLDDNLANSFDADGFIDQVWIANPCGILIPSW